MTSAVENRVRRSRPGRPDEEEWQSRARFLLRHLGDPIALESSVLARNQRVQELAAKLYPHGVVPVGRALHGIAMTALQEIERELAGLQGVEKLRRFTQYTVSGLGPTRAGRELGVSPEHASRAYKRALVLLVAAKLQAALK